jgi:hypothetical protein
VQAALPWTASFTVPHAMLTSATLCAVFSLIFNRGKLATWEFSIDKDSNVICISYSITAILIESSYEFFHNQAPQQRQ